MNIGLVDCDKTNYPNLALMKLSAKHKAKGDNVEFVTGFNHYNRIYIHLISLRLCRDTSTTNSYSEAAILLRIIADTRISKEKTNEQRRTKPGIRKDI